MCCLSTMDRTKEGKPKMKTRNKFLVAVLTASVAGAAIAAPAFAQSGEAVAENKQVAFRGHDRDGERGGYGEHRGPRGGKHAERGGPRGHGGPKGPRAGGPGGPGGPGMAEFLIERFDVDEDGTITAAEIEAVNAERVGNYDTDGDNALTLEEFTALWTDTNKERIVREFQQLDPDGDASVTLEEYSERFDKMMSRLDRDDDGVIGEDELRGPRGPGKGMGPRPGPDAPDGGPAPESPREG